MAFNTRVNNPVEGEKGFNSTKGCAGCFDCCSCVRWVLPVILACMLYFEFGDEYRAETISYRDIEDNNNGKVTTIIENDSQTFSYINYTTYSSLYLTVSRNNLSVSTEQLNQLLLKWLIDPTGMPNKTDTDKLRKINLLLRVSTFDFWAKNYLLHEKQGRVSWWMWVHARYLYHVRCLQDVAVADTKSQLLNDFLYISHKLQRHSYYEEILLFPFLKDTFPYDSPLKKMLIQLKYEHIPIHAKEDTILVEFDDDTKTVYDVRKSIKEWQAMLEEHFGKEEKWVVHLILKLDNSTYRRYLAYFTFGYLWHAAISFWDYTLTFFYIIN